MALTFGWEIAQTGSLGIPLSPSGYQVTPPLSPRLTISSGTLRSRGGLQSNDSGTYTIASTDFTGIVILSLTISGKILDTFFSSTIYPFVHTIVAGSPTVTLHWKDATSVPLLPTASSGYQVSPPLPSRLDMNSSGHLVSSGQLQSSDASIYNITSTDFIGTLIVMLKISGESH